MNYFDYFNLDEAYEIDLQELRKAFLERSREVHPDLGTDAASIEAIASSATINIAYETLKDPIKRIHYILELNCIPTDAKSAPLTNDFLMEMMEINEIIEESQFDIQAKSQANQMITDFDNALNATYSHTINQYRGDMNDKELHLVKLRDYLHKKNYLNRLTSLLEGDNEI